MPATFHVYIHFSAKLGYIPFKQIETEEIFLLFFSIESYGFILLWAELYIYKMNGGSHAPDEK